MEEVKCKGIVNSIVYANEENGFTVARLEVDNESFCITGTMPGISVGENIEVEGQWIEHSTYGMQINVKNYSIIAPSSENAIIQFLSSGVVKGIGVKMAKKIVDRFGTDTLRIMDENPDKLLQVQGIGKKMLKMITESYESNKGVKNVIVALAPYNINPKLSMKIYKEYKEKTLAVIKSNPYKLVDDIRGVGFHTADEIAGNIGIEKTSVFRISSGILYTLKEAINRGHTFLYEDQLVTEASMLLGVENELIEECIYDLAIKGKIAVEKSNDKICMYVRAYYDAELRVCENLMRLASNSFEDISIDVDEEIKLFQEMNAIDLAKKQKEAVKACFENGIVVITGGPGTGKTTTLNAIIKLFQKNGRSISLAAPTGRAAKRMNETTGMESKTIHRLLEMQFDADDRAVFGKNSDEPLESDVLIIDEASMIDIFLMDSLLKAVGQKTRLVLVGDADQLPSVGAGNVLRDIISSHAIKTIKLNEIFRQAQKSRIVTNAHRINNGEMIEKGGKDSDFFFMQRNSQSEVIEEIKTLVGGRLSTYYDVDPVKDIQVLAPMRNNDAGVNNLNMQIQNILNPGSKRKVEATVGKITYRVGDKVMQNKNNYSREWESEDGKQSGEGIYNGDIGYIYHIDKHSKVAYIKFDDYKIFKYNFNELDEIEHSFCTTIHKSQGSEFPIVIISIVSGPQTIINRSLIYTAVTRAKKIAVLVGSQANLEYMIRNNYSEMRNSNLDKMLRKYSRNMYLINDR